MENHFTKHLHQLNKEVFKQFKNTYMVSFTPPDGDTIEVECIYDKNPEMYSPQETNVIETIHVFTFKMCEVKEVPTGSIIVMDEVEYRVDAQEHNNHRLRGHSEGDGSMISVIAGETY